MKTAVFVVLLILATPTFGAAILPTAPPAQKTPVTLALPDVGTARGTLRVDGREIPLKYAYTVEVDDVEGAGMLLAGPRHFYVVVLSNKPLPQASVADRNAPQSEQKSIAQAFDPAAKSPVQTVYALLLRVDAATKKPFYAGFFFPGKESLSLSIRGGEVADEVDKLKIEKGQLSGSAHLTKPLETGEEKGPKKYQYSAVFRARLLMETAVTHTWEGTAALESPPAQAMRAYLIAAQKGDMETVRGLTAASHQAYLKKPEVAEMLKQGDPGKMAEQIRRVVVRGGAAAVVVVSETPNYSQVTIQMTRENGAWKMYWP